LKRFLAWLDDLLYKATHSRLERELEARPQQDDQAFYEAYYGSSGISKDIPIRIRKVYVEQLGECWRGVRPGDNVDEICPDVDFAEVLYEIEDEFRIKMSSEDMKKMEGTFDAVVRYVASQRQTQE
jgi:acyl carrier protein